MSMTKEYYDYLQSRTSSVERLVSVMYFILRVYTRGFMKRKIEVMDLVREAWLVLLNASQTHHPMLHKVLAMASIQVVMVAGVQTIKTNTIGSLLVLATGTSVVPLVCKEDRRLLDKLVDLAHSIYISLGRGIGHRSLVSTVGEMRRN